MNRTPGVIACAPNIETRSIIVKNRTPKIIIVAGARPNFMKVAPLIKMIDRHNSSVNSSACIFDARLLHTGQHYDPAMSDIFFRELSMRAPDICLEVGSGSHAVQTARVLIQFEVICEREKPDWVIVVGDVNSTMACTLVCSKLGIPIAHVEAGLRSFDRSMPEEINRIVTDSLADLLLTPSQDADENLRREGTPDSKIKLVGNIMIDTLVHNLEKARNRGTHKGLGLKERTYAYVTLHRPSNVDNKEALSAIISELNELSQQIPVIFPMHPRTRKRISEFAIALRNDSKFAIIDPVGYHDSLCLTEHARFVLTDSGGLQEESTYFEVPCLTLRPNTERPITLTLGSNKLTSIESLRSDIGSAIRGEPRIGKAPPLWDGNTAERILKELIEATMN